MDFHLIKHHFLMHQQFRGKANARSMIQRDFFSTKFFFIEKKEFYIFSSKYFTQFQSQG